MPGNEVGDRVHNFFAQDNLSQSQPRSQVADGNWPVLNSNLWVGSQRQIGATSSNLKNYNSQQTADLERGNSSHSLVSHGLNSTQSNWGPGLPKSQPHSQHPNLNGYMYGRQVSQTRPDEANFMGVDTESDRHNLIASGLSVYETSQGSGPEHPTTLVGVDSSESPVSFDFFGGQQHMSGQNLGILQSFPQQQSGFSDLQQLQQQVMLRKMQELQRQKEIQQLDARQQNSINQITSFTRQASGNTPHGLVNGTQLSDASNYPWGTELTAGNSNWLQRASPANQGSSSGLVFHPEQVQPPRSTGLVHQQGDQSLYGVPISSSRGTAIQYPHIAPEKPSQQMATYTASFQGNQYSVLTEQVNSQDETLISRQGFQGKKLFEHNSGQGVNSGINMENLQHLNPLQMSVPVQDFQWRQEIVGPSEVLQEKTAVNAASSQNSVGLDPTEEKILFGSDDSIWDAFGRSTDTGGGASNLLDGTLNGFPSIQSGSWSALMQSAVAETSSSNLGLQEQWTGLSFQNAELPTVNHQPLAYNDRGKGQTALADKNLQSAAAFDFRHAPPSDDANANNNHHSPQGFQHFEQNNAHEHGERLQTNSSQRPIPQSSGGGSKWLNRGPLQKQLAEGSQIRGNTSQFLGGDMNEKSISNQWTPQQSRYSQPSDKPNQWNASGDATFSIHENENSLQYYQSKDQKRVVRDKFIHDDGVWNVNSAPKSAIELQQLRSTTGSPQLNMEGSSLNNAAAVPNPSNSRAREETSQFLPNSHPIHNWKHVGSSVNSKEGSNPSGKLQYPTLNKGSQVVESSLNIFEKQDFEKHEMENFSKKENPHESYRSNLSQHVSAGDLRVSVLSDASESQSLPVGKQKSSNQAGRKTSGTRKFQYHPMGNLDEDVEPSYQLRQPTHSQAMSLHNSQGLKGQDQGFLGQSKLFGQVHKSSTEVGKVQSPDRQGDSKGLEDLASRGTPPGYAPNISAPFNRSISMTTSNKASHLSQNMLELLHKVDQSKEHGTVMQMSSSDRQSLSDLPEAEISGYGGRLQRSQSSNSQGFGLQLAPPSQRLPVPNRVTQNLAQSLNSCSSTQATPEIGKCHTKLAPTISGQSLPSSHENSQADVKNDTIFTPGETGGETSLYKMSSHFSSVLNSGFPYSRSQLQNQLTAGFRGQGSLNQSVNVPFDRQAPPSKHADDPCSRLTGQSAEASLPNTVSAVPFDNLGSSGNTSPPTTTYHPREIAPAAKISAMEALSVSRPLPTTGIAQQGAFPKMSSNIWTNVPAQHVLGAQARQVQPNVSQSQQSNNVESKLSPTENLENQDAKRRGNISSDLGGGSMRSQNFVCGEAQLTKESPSQQVFSGNNDLAQKKNESQGKEAILKHLSDASLSNPASTQRDIEAFGRSLKPNHFFHQNYSLLNQVRAMKNADTDPINRGLKRLKGPNNILAGEQVASKSGQANESNVVVGDTSVSSSVPSGDTKVLSFSGPEDCLERNASSLIGNLPSQDMLALDKNESQNYPLSNSTTVRIEQPKISPQMAPSWFNQYGSFKNGQILPQYDARKAVKTLEQPFTLGKSSGSLNTLNSSEHVNAAADTSQIHNNWQTSNPVSLAIGHFSSSLSLPPGIVGQKPVVRPKKRKNATSELQSWHKEVSECSRNLQTISMAEVHWAKAANRLREKLEDVAGTVEDGLPMLKARRRLILTAQLMQQLLSPPPAAILSADASSNYETISYFIARLALGDTCGLISSKSYSDALNDGVKFQADKCKISDKIDDQLLSQVLEDFMGRTRRLENDLLRLDKRTSFLDLRVESQDIEKISVINRFAKYHGRGQADGAETSSSSDAAANAQKSSPQKYVTAVPVPRNFPDRVQCISL